SGYWWGEGGSSRLGPSPFLEEVRKSGVAEVSAWADAPEPDAENPLLAGVDAADWPVTPAGQRYEAVREAAALVEQALAQPAATPQSEDLGARDLELTEAWGRDAGLLLAERAQRRGDGATQVPLPARLSVSSLVTLARDPAELARQVRRPMPRPPGHGLPPVAGAAVRPAAAHRRQRAVRSGGRRHGRGRPGRAPVQVRAGRVGRALAAGGRGAV